MVLNNLELTDVGWREERHHDPDPLSLFVQIHDVGCDGPTSTRLPAARCDLDHDTPHPHGPTAAWNLTARSRRTHGLKHRGWTPLRTADSTIWTSPAGQLIEVPRYLDPPPGIDRDTGDCTCGSCHQPQLPEPVALAQADRELLTAATLDDQPSTCWLQQAQPTARSGDDDPAPF